jgi:N-dimethylarginine dimethylaminohydrolase
MIYSQNEWGVLKKIVVGSATNAHWPVNCEKFRSLEKTSLWQETPLPAGPVSEFIISEANEDLENLTNTLEKLGVNVVRPEILDFKNFDGMYNYCPRDRVLIVGDVAIDAPMVYPTRLPEIDALKKFLPKTVSCDNQNAFFDAANVCRLGKDLLYLVSSSGNRTGGEWLQETLGDSYKVHILDNIYSGVHIDSTISPIREGLVVINQDRISEKNLPQVFENWDIIWMSGDDIIPQGFVGYPYASKYIALNFLTVNSNLIICDPNQNILRKKLEKYNVESIGINLRHSRTLGGGHHCVTLDLERE